MFRLSVDRVTGDDKVEDLDGDKYYAKGNSAQLQKYLAKLSDKTDMKVSQPC
jgi:hypothetical protein